MIVQCATAGPVDGKLPPTAAYAAREWVWVTTPGDAPGRRIGTLTLTLTPARGGRTTSDTYAVSDGGPVRGLMGHRFHLHRLTRAADGSAAAPYEVVIGPLGRCDCAAGVGRPRSANTAGCKHRDALAALAARGLVPGGTDLLPLEDAR